MTKEERIQARAALIDSFMGAVGYHLIQGQHSVAPVMPWVVMNTQYHIFDDDLVGEHAPTQELKRIASRWNAAYRAFNHQFWSRADAAGVDAMVDLMDRFEEDVAPYVERLRASVVAAIDCPHEDVKQAIVNAYICQVFALVAQTMHSSVFRRIRYIGGHKVMTPKRDENLDKLASWAHAWYMRLMCARGVQPIAMTPEIERLQGELCRAAVKWLKTEDRAVREEGEK